MRKIRLDNNVRMIGKKVFKDSNYQIHYYLVTNDNQMFYAFSKRYTHHTYNMCKSGILVNELITKRTRDAGVMRLVKYTNFILPYLAEIYDLPLAQ